MKKLLSIMALFVVSLLAVSMFVSALDEGSSLGGLDSTHMTVKVNDEEATGSLLSVEEGDNLNVEVKLDNSVGPDASNVEVEARLLGYDEEDTRDSKIVPSVKNGTEKKVNLNVQIPNDFANGPNAVLRVSIYGGNKQYSTDYDLYVESASHSMAVSDVSFSPGNTVRAGESLLTTVLVENTGEHVEDNVKVNVEIPELGLSASEFLDSVDVDEKQDVPEMFLKIPATTAPGDYEAKVTVKYNDLEDSVSETYPVSVIANDYLNNDMFPTSDKVVLQVGPESQTAAAGQTVSFNQRRRCFKSIST